MKLSTTAICLVACLFSPVQAKRKSKNDDSSCFNKQGNDFREYGDTVYAVSPVQECKDDECDMESEDVQIDEERFLNVTTDNADEVFDVIKEMTGLDFDESLSGEAGSGVTITVGSGNKTYIGFTQVFKCVNGTMGDCVEGLKAGSPIKACYPDKTDEGEPSGLLQAMNSTDTPDVKFKPVGAASGLTVDIKLLSLVSFLAVGGVWALPSL